MLVYEVANGLHYNPRVSEEQLTGRVQDVFDYDLDLVPPSNEYVTRAARTARRLSISIYDASYIVLSKIVSTNLVTADKNLYDKASAKGQSRLLKTLGRTWTLPE